MITRAADPLAADLIRRAFRPRRQTPLRGIGAEVEVIPVDADSGAVCPFESAIGLSTLALLREYGEAEGWVETQHSSGAWMFRLPDSGTLTPEPGGQLEYSSPRCRSITELMPRMLNAIEPLMRAASDVGITMLSSGIDPVNDIGQVPLQLSAPRYRKMTAYFEAQGHAGVRMMRQTAAIQVNLDFLEEPMLRWTVLNALAPYITATFANSPIYAGSPTGCQSYRAETWRHADPSRTGLLARSDDPVLEYLEFALNAPAMLLPPEDDGYRPFRWWWSHGGVSLDDWHAHLTTLFPEVRPRGYLESRSIDALRPEWYAVPICFLAGIVYDHESLHAAADLVGRPNPELLQRAGIDGLADPAIGDVARDLFEIALQGCDRFGPEFVAERDVEVARAFFDRYTRQGRAPADDALDQLAATLPAL
jgi:glutamate--cysteine ligase